MSPQVEVQKINYGDKRRGPSLALSHRLVGTHSLPRTPPYSSSSPPPTVIVVRCCVQSLGRCCTSKMPQSPAGWPLADGKPVAVAAAVAAVAPP